ncbi:MAG: hypothetical protein WCW52_12265 [Elusimicrobiales bacterium]|jgi:hypothetical protein
MLSGIKKCLAMVAVFAVIGIGIHAASHDLSTHSADGCVLCIAASSVIPVNSVTGQPAEPKILFSIVPVADVPVKSTFYNTIFSRGPPVL